MEHLWVSALLRRLLLCAVFLAAWFAPRDAAAYPWMIRHEYTACATCHTDPSGGGLLTRYGRAQAALLLSSPLALPKNEEEPGKYKDFAFGVVPLPEQVDFQGWGRGGYLLNMSDGKVVDKRVILMRGDLGTHLRFGPVRASGTAGIATEEGRVNSQEAWVTHNATGVNAVSREHWLGVSLADDAILVRAGRINLPYGLRNIEHTTWVRNSTHTDTNSQQQHGVAISYTGERLRGELMGIAGNFQIRPDAYRERGYAAFAEYSLGPAAAIGISSSVAHANADPAFRRQIFRQAHGLFARLVPAKPLVLLAEADVLVKSIKLDNPSTDATAMLQADLEPWRGIHFVGTGEMLTNSRAQETYFGGWLGAWVFLFAHLDARVDGLYRTAGNAPGMATVLFQLHGWL